jgi:hypothetical protein
MPQGSVDDHPVHARHGSLSAVVVGRHKLIYDGESRGLELYDLQADRKEQHNLVDRDPATRQRLVRALEKISGKKLDL